MAHRYTLAEVRNGTGWDRGVTFTTANTPGCDEPLDTWPAAAKGSQAERSGFVTVAELHAIRAARFAAYQRARLLDQDHAKAVKEANRAAVKVARALGFSYPQAHGNVTF